MKRDLLRINLAAALLLLGTATPSYAYLDPGTASIVLQSIIGGIAAGAATIGLFWQRIKLFFSRKSRASE